MNVKLRIRLRDLETLKEIIIINDVFDKENGIAWHSIDNTKWGLICCDSFTGLKDKNGKEIYERDVLTLANNENITVDFKSGKFIGIRKNGTISITSFYWIYSEIIGNIYENPELISAVGV